MGETWSRTWFNVKIFLPTANNLVLVYLPRHGGVKMDKTVSVFASGPGAEVGQYLGDDWAENDPDHITHWMPLPDPPTTESD